MYASRRQALSGLLSSVALAGLGTTLVQDPAQASYAINPDRIIKANPSILVHEKDFAYLRQNQDKLATFLNRCARELSYQPSPVADLAPAPHYDANGVNTSPKSGAIFSRDVRVAYRLAIRYRITRETEYALKALQIIDAWASTLTAVSTRQGEADLNFNSAHMILAAYWAQVCGQWDNATFKDFLRNLVLPHSTSDRDNNHGFWGVLTEACVAGYLGDKVLLQQAKDRWETLLIKGVDDKGEMPLERDRSATSNWHGGPDKGKKGIAYTHYALLPASHAAKIFVDLGLPAWATPGGKKLEQAYGVAARWTNNPASFPYYESNKGQLDGVRDAAYFALLSRVYPDPAGKKALADGSLGSNGLQTLELFPSF
ncbi:alginate lyase family protein [Rothia sp. CCM 9417]|uniref:alginate lyase family protein n=1 Tax=unclassified Rothia (in: high G+C Gram-positive bacteria) TaxID=2689056 RepID=UPI003AC67CD9